MITLKVERPMSTSLCLSLPCELWQPHLDRLTDFKVAQPNPGSAESLFLRTFLKLGKNLRFSSPLVSLATPPVHKRLKTDLTLNSNLGPQ